MIGISLAHFAIGPRAIIGGVAVNPTMAGEDRFFAGLLLCYGIALLWCARDMQHKRIYIDVLATALFVGGIGRCAPSAVQVSLGDTEVFEELGRLTAPRVEYRDSWWPTFTWLLPGAASSLESAGAPGGAVNLLGRQRIGPFDVTRLAANDPTALATWLADKGFPRPDSLDANLAPYIADHWEIVAIQLAPAQAGESLTGDLQPLRLSFTSDKLVYPMRLSRSATTRS